MFVWLRKCTNLNVDSRPVVYVLNESLSYLISTLTLITTGINLSNHPSYTLFDEPEETLIDQLWTELAEHNVLVSPGEYVRPLTLQDFHRDEPSAKTCKTKPRCSILVQFSPYGKSPDGESAPDERTTQAGYFRLAFSYASVSRSSLSTPSLRVSVMRTDHFILGINQHIARRDQQSNQDVLRSSRGVFQALEYTSWLYCPSFPLDANRLASFVYLSTSLWVSALYLAPSLYRQPCV